MNMTLENATDLAFIWLWCQVAILALAGLGAPLVASLSQLGPFPSKAFLHKLARQLAGLSLILLLALVLFILINQFYCQRAHPELLPESVRPFALIGIGSLGLAFFLVILYRALWKPLNNAKALLASLGLMAGLAGLDSVFLILGLKRTLLLTPEVFSSMTFQQALRQIFIPPASSAFWPFVAQMWLLCITSAGAMSLVYLLLRRNRDDYGRDYYNFCLKHCARFAWIPALLQLPFMGWILWRMTPAMGGWTSQNPVLWSFGAAALALLLGVLLWNSISRSATPLREKPLMFLALLMPGTTLWAMALPFMLQLTASA